jgi:anti-sigma factor RsiW
MNLMERSPDVRPDMDHRYIDQYAVAERYLDHSLSPGERAAFEAHLVDCQECTDRVLLAEMFHARQPSGLPARPASQSSLVLRLKPRQLALLVIIALLALTIPVFAFFLAYRR